MKFFTTRLQPSFKIEQLKLQGMFHVKHPLQFCPGEPRLGEEVMAEVELPFQIA